MAAHDCRSRWVYTGDEINCHLNGSRRAWVDQLNIYLFSWKKREVEIKSSDHSAAKVNGSCGTIECQMSLSLSRNNNFAQAQRYHAGNPIVTDRAKQYQLSNQFEFLLIFWLYAINSHNSLKSLFLSSAFHNFVSGNFSSLSFPLSPLLIKHAAKLIYCRGRWGVLNRKFVPRHFAGSVIISHTRLHWILIITIRMLTTFVALVSQSLRRRFVSYGQHWWS